MAELDSEALAKYKRIIAGALEQIETASDRAGVQANAEAFRVQAVKRYVKPDPVAVEAFYKLHRSLGEAIRLLVEVGHELDRIELVDNLDDLDDLRYLGGE